MDNKSYLSLVDFVADFHLMFANAMTYNVEGSFVWNDAMELRTLFDATVRQVRSNVDL